MLMVSSRIVALFTLVLLSANAEAQLLPSAEDQAANVFIPSDAERVERARMDALLEDAQSLHEAHAAAAVLELERVEPWIAPRAALDAYEAVRSTIPHGLPATLLAYRQLRIAERLGDLERAATLQTELGFITDWRVIGPFPNDGMEGLRTRYPPETEGVVEGEWAGRNQAVRWRAVEGASQSGYLDLEDLIAPAFDVVTYLAVDLEVDERQPATLDLAVDGAYRVWLNGRPVAEQPNHLGGFATRDFVEVHLVAGINQLVIKIATDDHFYGLHARVLDSAQAPVAVRAAPAAWRAQPLEAATEWSRPQTPFERLITPRAAPRDVLAAAFVAKHLHPLDPEEPWRFTALQPDDPALTPRDLLRAAEIERERWAKMRWLDAAMQRDPNADVTVAWADAHASELGAEPRRMVSRVLIDQMAVGTATVATLRQWGRLCQQAGFTESAYAFRHLILQAFPFHAGLLAEQAAAVESLQRTPERLSLLTRAWLVQQSSSVLARDLIHALTQAGERDAAQEVLDQVAALLPLDAEIASLQSDWFAAASDLDAARAVQTAAIARCPGCEEAYVRRGDLAFEAGDLDAAVADWERALALQPQNVDLRLRLAALQPDRTDAFETLRLSVDEIVALAAEAESSASAGYVTLVDQRFVSLQPSGLASTWTQQAWRVDSRAAADELRALSVSYTPDAERVERLELVVVKPDGRRERAVSTDDFNAQSGPAAMYFDLRVRRWDVNNLEEGDVLIVEWRTDDVAYRNLFDDYFGDVWVAQSSSPRVLSRYAIERPASRVLYDNRASLDDAIVSDRETDAGVLTVFEWRDVPGLVLEPGAPGVTEIAPFVSVSTANDWSALADWYWDLVEDQLVTSAEIEETVEALVAGVTDPVERVQRIYAYVVRNTRYVGLEFGIHGYKPYRTTECFARRFGDCKDTASLLKVMLELAGIPTHLVLVRTRDRGRVGAFPPSLAVFNHAIAYVPSLDLYLDGTAAFSGALELPTGDQGASALIVEDGRGGSFLEIPALPATDSVERFTLVVDLRDTPSGHLDWSTSGTLAAGMRRWAESAGDLVSQLQRELGGEVVGLEVLEVEPSDPSDIDRPLSIRATFEGGRWTTGTDADITLHPLISDPNWVRRFAGPSTRTLPLEFEEAWREVSEYRIRIPASWRLRSTLQTVHSESPFGTWSYTQSLGEDGWLDTRFEVTFDVIRLTPAQYSEFRAWLSEADAVATSRLQFEDMEVGQ